MGKHKITAEQQEMILKTIETGMLATGGQLQPRQQKRFERIVRSLPGMLSKVRFESVSQKKSVIDRLHIGEPITFSVEENDNTANKATPVSSQIEYNTKKLKSGWDLTTEVLIENLEKGNLENTVMQMMTERIGTDFELLTIQGDRTTYAAVNTPFGRLLRRLNGWDIQSGDVHIVDCGGSTIVKDIFAEMIRTMPQQYLGDPGLRWIMSSIIATDWMDLIADRGTALGDRAIEGYTPSPYGIPIMTVPLIPSDKTLSSVAGTSAVVIGTRADVFKIETGVNDKVTLNVDAAGNIAVTLNPGTQFVSQIANTINSTAGLAGVASDNGFGQLVLKSPTVGIASTVEVVAVANNAYTTLGLTVAVTTGSNVGVAGNLREGSYIWLANPLNFYWVMLNQTRMYTEFNKDYDRLEIVVYNEIDCGIELRDAVVKGTNIKRRTI